LAELLDSATVDLVNQDGGEQGLVEAIEPWMQKIIEKAFHAKYTR